MKRCEWCGRPLPEDTRKDNRFCIDKSSCRTAAWRARKRRKAWTLASLDNEKKIFYQR